MRVHTKSWAKLVLVCVYSYYNIIKAQVNLFVTLSRRNLDRYITFVDPIFMNFGTLEMGGILETVLGNNNN